MQTNEITSQTEKTTISLNDYINKLCGNGSFIIPDYQRGYVWGQRHKEEPLDSVTFLIRSLKDSYPNRDIFLQGITVHKIEDTYNIVLVDGQQRTTFFYLLLKFLGYNSYIKIKYDIREQSNKFLNNLDLADISRDEEEEYQDIFFFKRTLRIFERELNGYDKKRFLKFILTHVKFLFVIIPSEQDKIVFTMMNGNKAKMTEEELIKAELLRCASLQHDLIQEAEHSELRSRLAREWDKWLYWWNDCNVSKYFRTGGRQLGWLLPLILEDSKINFKNFRDKLLDNHNIKQAKQVFKEMRLLQKRIEDIYENSYNYNYIGVIMYIRNSSEQRFAFLRWLFTNNHDINYTEPESESKSESELKRYYKWCIIGVNHEDIVANRIEKYTEARENFLKELSSSMLFLHHYETAYRWLLLRNIKEDNHYKGRKFNFDIERERSIEHVYPKSKIGHKSDAGIALNWEDKPIEQQKLNDIKLWREEMKWYCEETKQWYDGSEHCIGNLLILYKRDNSKFNNADFRKKNEYFFTDMDDESFKSRHLIHTTCVFSDINWVSPNEPWNKEQVPRRKYEEINEFIKEYPEINQ